MRRQLRVAAIAARDRIVLHMLHMAETVAQHALHRGIAEADADAPVDPLHVFLAVRLARQARQQHGAASMPDRFAEPAGKGIDLGMIEIAANRLLRLQMPRSCQHRFECRKLGRGQTMGEAGFAADAALGPRSRRRDRIAEWGHRDVSVAVCLSFRPIGPHGNVGHATSGGGEQP